MKKLLSIFIPLLIVGLIAMSSCTKKDEIKTATVSINLPDGGARALIASVTLRVTAPNYGGFEQTRSVTPTTVVVTFEVQLTGDNTYTFFVTARDSGGTILYWGRVEADVNTARSLEINIEPAAQGAANHIKIFRDYLPWESTAMDSMLASQGYTVGTGENQYEIFGSSDFDTVTLRAGTDLVIIVNDQDQNFYNRYAQNMQKFNNFVQRGGVIFWEACDRGWNNGSILDAGVTLPGGVTVDSTYIYDNYNLIYNSNYELVQGLPDTLYGTYASHETFTNLPENSQIFTLNMEERKPTLILYNYGLGWLMVTGQPLEYTYDRLPEQTTGLLLSRVVNFILGNQGGNETFTSHTSHSSPRTSAE